MRRIALLCASASALCIPTYAYARGEYIDSALAAIDSASAQGRLSLVQGTYRAKSGNKSVIIEIPAAMSSTLTFVYRNRSIANAVWTFDRPIFITLRYGPSCVRFSVRKLAYGDGGFLSGASDQTISPTGPCRDSEAFAAQDDFLRLSSDPADFFRGEVFVGLDGMEKCADATCATVGKGMPIRRAQFYNSSTSTGQPSPAFNVSFRDGARLILPRNGFLVLGNNSAATFDSLDYDLETGSGSALLRKFEVDLNDGVMSGGQTTLHFKAGSRFTAEEMRFDKNDSAVVVSRGAVTGHLANGSSIILSNDQAKSSIINIQSADVSLAGLTYNGNATGDVLGISRGILTTQIANAELWFSERNSVRFGYTSLNLVLGCPDVAAPGCKAVTWGTQGISVFGTINSFGTTLTGGQFNVFNVGEIQLKSGQIAADQLTLDSTNRLTPITGKINKIEVIVEGQNLRIDGQNTIQLAQATFNADDLVFKPGQALPIGLLSVKGVAEKFEGGALGPVSFAANAKLNLTITHRDGDEPEITDGAIEGDARVGMSSNGTAEANVSVQRIRYYRGHGDAELKLTVKSATYSYQTPTFHDSASKLGFTSDVNVRSVKIAGSLASPLIFSTAVKASQSAWKIDQIIGVPYDIRLGIASQELVYAPIKTPIGGTLCAPKVNLADQSPDITGKIDVFGSSTGGKVRIYDNSLSAGIVADADDRGCDKIADLVCFVAGDAALGPIGGAGLAIICNSNLEEAKRKLADQIRDQSIDKVAQARFDFSF